MRSTTAISPAPPGSSRELFRVALPLIVSAGSLSLMQFCDRLFLTWYSDDALAAALPASLLNWTVMSVVIGTAMYVNTFVAQYEGAGRRDRVAASMWQGIYLSLAAGLGLLFVVPFSAEIFALVGHDPAVQRLESDYFSIVCAGAMPITLSAVMSCFYSGRGKSLVVMWVNFAAVGVNAVLDAVLIFGPGPFPRLGMKGAAIATVAANVVSVIVYATLLLREREYPLWRERRFDPALFARIVRHGLPNGLQFLMDIASFSLFVFLVGRLGKVELAATNLTFNLNLLAFLPMLGLGTAVMTLVGTRIGEGRPQLAVRTTWIAFLWSGSYMALFVSAYLFLPEAIMHPFTLGATEGDFPAIAAQTKVLLRFLAAFSFFDAMAVVFGSAIRGAGDTRFSLAYTTFTCWVLMALPTAIATIWFGGSLIVSWWACTTYIVALGAGFMLRFHRGRWQSMRVIEAEPDLVAAELGPVSPDSQDSPPPGEHPVEPRAGCAR
ncbi:MAG: MATE family efflux transporter [Planctomycetales bacterium]